MYVCLWQSANLAKRKLVLHWRKPVGKIYIIVLERERRGKRAHYLSLAQVQTATNSTKLQLMYGYNYFKNGGECKKFPFSQNTQCGHLLARTQTPEGPTVVNLWSFNVVWQQVVKSVIRIRLLPPNISSSPVPQINHRVLDIIPVHSIYYRYRVYNSTEKIVFNVLLIFV